MRGLSGVGAIAAGTYHSLALLTDGTVRAWGDNESGQLGDGTTTLRTTPVPVSGLSGVVAIAGGFEHSLVLLADGTVRAWGHNYNGQLGDGTLTDRHTPVSVNGSARVMAIAAGSFFNLALSTDGPQLALTVNQPALHGGSPHTARATLLPGPTPAAANVFLALQLPDASLLYLRGDGTLTPAGEPMATATPVPTYTGQVFQHTFTGTEPAGTYLWLGALADPTTGAFLGPLAEAPFTVNPPTTGPQVTLVPNHAFLRTGQRHTLQVTLAAGTAPLTADVYLALRLPTGALLFLHGDGSLSGSPAPYGTSWAGGLENRRVFQYDFTGGEPAGTYTWLAGFTEPGTMTFLGPILSAPFSFAP